jgi:hypothetical protein
MQGDRQTATPTTATIHAAENTEYLIADLQSSGHGKRQEASCKRGDIALGATLFSPPVSRDHCTHEPEDVQSCLAGEMRIFSGLAAAFSTTAELSPHWIQLFVVTGAPKRYRMRREAERRANPLWRGLYLRDLRSIAGIPVGLEEP